VSDGLLTSPVLQNVNLVTLGEREAQIGEVKEGSAAYEILLGGRDFKCWSLYSCKRMLTDFIVSVYSLQYKLTP
jgi:hypothetical protein